MDLEAPQQDKKLADKSIGPGESYGGEGYDHKEGRKPGLDLGQSPKVGDFARVTAFVDHADQQEEGPRADPVVDDL